MEASLVPRHGYDMAWVRFSGLRGKGLLRALALPLNLLVAFWQSARAIIARAPGRGAGHGRLHQLSRRHDGFAAQASAGDPRAELGRGSGQQSARAPRRPGAGRHFPDALPDAEVCGNPVRREIAALAPPRARCAARSGRLQAAGARRQPGRAGAERDRAAGAGAAARGGASGGDAPAGAQTSRSSARRLRRGRCARGSARFHRRHGGALRRGRCRDLPRRRAYRRRTRLRRRGQHTRAVSVMPWTIIRPAMRISSPTRARPSCCRRPNCPPSGSQICCAGSRASGCSTWPRRQGRWASRTRPRLSRAPAWSWRNETQSQTYPFRRDRRTGFFEPPLPTRPGMKHKVKRIHFVGIGAPAFSNRRSRLEQA